MMKRFVAVSVIVMLLFSVLPAGAMGIPLPDESLDFTVEESLLAGEGWSWEPETLTLTLNGINLTVENRSAIKVPEGSTIVLETGPSNQIQVHDGWAIEGMGDLTVKGTGNLEIRADDGDGIGIESGTAKNGGAQRPSLNLEHSGRIEISGMLGLFSIGDLSVTGTGQTIVWGTAEYSGDAGHLSREAVHAFGDLRVSTGILGVIGGSLYALGDVRLENESQVLVVADIRLPDDGDLAKAVPLNDTVGIRSGGSLWVHGSTVNASGSDAGIDVAGLIMIEDNSTVTVGPYQLHFPPGYVERSIVDDGMRASGIRIVDSAVTASGNRYGIAAEGLLEEPGHGDIVIQAGTVYADATDRAALYASGEIELVRSMIEVPSGARVADLDVEEARSQSVTAGGGIVRITSWDDAAKAVTIVEELRTSRGGRAPEPVQEQPQPEEPEGDEGDSVDQGPTEPADALEVTLFIDRRDYDINGTEDVMDVEPFVEEGRTFVPVRVIAEAFGASVHWTVEEGTGRVLIESDELSIELTMGQTSIRVVRDGQEQEVNADVASFIRNGRSWLPLRAIGEILGATFDYGPKDGPVEWVRFSR